jgi:nitroreductase
MDRQEMLHQLISAAFLAPTSFNLQHFRFIDVQDKDKQQTLLSAAGNWADEGEPEFVIALCGDNNSWQKAANFAKHVSDEFVEMSQQKATMVYSNNEITRRDEVNRTNGFAFTNMLVKAHHLGLGSRVLEIDSPSSVTDLLNISDAYSLSAVVVFDKALVKPLLKSQPYLNLISEDGF